MQSKYRRRSTMSWFIWGSACFVLVALLAWQFEWFPQQKQNDLVESQNSVAQHDSLTSGQSESMPTPDDPAIFDDQPEPNFDTGNPFAKTDTNMANSATQNKTITDPQVQPGSYEENKPKVDPFQKSSSNSSQSSQKTTNQAERQNMFPNNSRSQPVWEGAAKTHPPASFFQKVDGLITGNEIFEAHHELSNMYWKHPEWREDLQNRIDGTAKAIYFSPERHFIAPYQIQYGDNLTKIANRYKVSSEYLSTLNRVHPRSIREGEQLKVHNGTFSAVIDLSEFELIVHHHGYYVRKFRIGIGKDDSSPIGKLKVENKVVNPTYYGRDERTGKNFVIEGDDPQNPLGEKWIDIGNSFGIHGTIDPDSIGKAMSKGCIRLRNSDIEDVFDFLVVGSEIVIKK